MKKILMTVAILLGLSVSGTYACSPVIYNSVTILVFNNGTDIVIDSKEYNYDLMINKTDYPGYVNDEVNEQYKMDYSNYDSFSYLNDGDWVSYSAYYSFNVSYKEYYIITFSSMEYNEIQEYKIVVFDDNGQVVKVSEVYLKDDYGYIPLDRTFNSIAHTFDETSLTFGIEETGNGCEGLSAMDFVLRYFLFGIGSLTAIYLFTVYKNRRN